HPPPGKRERDRDGPADGLAPRAGGWKAGTHALLFEPCRSTRSFRPGELGSVAVTTSPLRRPGMHAVVTKVSVTEGESETKNLREQIVPQIKEAPGVVAAYWVRLEGGDEGNSVIVFESEEQARGDAEQIPRA